MDISPQRITTIQNAIELGVDDDDFRFESTDERETWAELVDLHVAGLDREDTVWLAA